MISIPRCDVQVIYLSNITKIHFLINAIFIGFVVASLYKRKDISVKVRERRPCAT